MTQQSKEAKTMSSGGGGLLSKACSLNFTTFTERIGGKLLRMNSFPTCMCWFDLGLGHLGSQVGWVYIPEY